MKQKKIEFDYKYGFAVKNKNVFVAKKGLDEDKILEISSLKNEPQWMLEKRLKAYTYFLKQPMPTWGADLSKIILMK